MKSETNQQESSESTVIDKPLHYPEVDPWKLQESMKSFGDAYVDARRCDAMKYVFRDKNRIEDLIKARNCIDAAIRRMKELKSIKSDV